MSKYMKLIIFCTLAILTLCLTGCADTSKISPKAIYLMQENGQFTKEELQKYPEILVTSNFEQLKQSVTKNTAIWIDKNAISLVDEKWLHKEPQNQVPLVLVGYNDALYSFREKLTGFGIEGVYVDWSKKNVETGFSVWKLKQKTKTSTSSFMKGYDVIPDVKQILSITNTLLEGEIPE